jgi:peptidoglycan-N-acetylglucosamine deacetylase
MKSSWIHLCVFTVIIFISYGSVTNPYTTSYVDQLKTASLVVSKSSDPLYQEIEEKASSFEIAPQNAVIHKVWKAMPGYNGRKVDIEKSYEKMKSVGTFSKEKLVFEQVKPDKMLKDLPPSPIYRGHPDKPMVSFLINVAWGNEYIPVMLKTLKEHGVKATFFLEGKWVKNNANMVKMIVDAGHEIGNHSYSHPDMKTLSINGIRTQIKDTNDVIKATTGITPKWFAPPSGSYRDDVVKVAAEYNLGTLLWSVDTVDWKKPNPTTMVDRVVSKVHNGAMILMHPTEATSLGLDRMIRKMKEKGYRISNVSTLLSEERIFD